MPTDALTPILLLLLTILTVLYLVFGASSVASGSPPPPRRRNRCRRNASSLSPYAPRIRGEPFTTDGTTGGGQGAGDPRIQMQRMLDFSDVHLSEAHRQEAARAAADSNQLPTVDERFEAAKRNVTENKLKAGVYTQKQRRQLVETLLRRPHCGRRVRSWRTENSDILRGDVRPKRQNSSTNIMRSAKGDPHKDLHPGALGPMAGISGKWLSDELLPGNVVPEGLVFG